MSNYNRALHRTREKHVTDGGKGVSVSSSEMNGAKNYSRIVDWGDKNHSFGRNLDEVNSSSKGVSKMSDDLWKTKRSQDHNKAMRNAEPDYIAHVNLKKTDKNTQQSVKKGAVASDDKITVVKNPMKQKKEPEQIRSSHGNSRRKGKRN